MRVFIPATAIGLALAASAATVAQAQTVITQGPLVTVPAATVVAQPMETVQTTETVRTIQPVRGARRQIVTTRTITRRIAPAPTVVARTVPATPQPLYDEVVTAPIADSPQPLYDSVAAPVVAQARLSPPLPSWMAGRWLPPSPTSIVTSMSPTVSWSSIPPQALRCNQFRAEALAPGRRAKLSWQARAPVRLSAGARAADPQILRDRPPRADRSVYDGPAMHLSNCCY